MVEKGAMDNRKTVLVTIDYQNMINIGHQRINKSGEPKGFGERYKNQGKKKKYTYIDKIKSLFKSTALGLFKN